MPIFFRGALVREPFAFDSVGSRWLQEDTCRPNGYPFYHYLQTLEGCGRILIQGKPYLLGENEGVLLAPSVSHSYARRTEQWITCFCTFTGTVEGSIARILDNRPIIFTGKEQGQRIAPLIGEAVELYEHPPVDAQALSLLCYRLLLQFVEGITSQALLTDPLYLRYVAPVIEEIETHYAAPLTVGALSRRVYVTPQYLSRLFRRFLGCSVYEYLTACRINRAKELLLTHPHMAVQEVALLTGFSDTSHFISMFKKATGCTPLYFRKFH
ncbi:MAG: AraC family transcriptional regulator [Eubacteriales bacterium]|nr:AraC family transcriptional regulator [Eubacteriales bacterium]